MSIIIDILLSILTVYLAVRSLLAPKLSKAVFTFFAFGLMLALAWIRLDAIDVAIAEAAIASGFMGVLFLDALRDFSSGSKKGMPNDVPVAGISKAGSKTVQFLSKGVLAAGMLLFLLIAWEAIWYIPDGGGLAAASERELPNSGVEHPVTAVLLNYRAYDTWLEVGVILIGLLAIFAAGGVKQYRKPSLNGHDPLLRLVILIFTPVLFLFGAFLLYFGKTGPGGAFQAAVLWGGIGILLYLGGWPIFTKTPRRLRQLILTSGFLFFLGLGFLFMLSGAAFFEYPKAQAGFLILLVETLAAVSIAAALTGMYAFLTK